MFIPPTRIREPIITEEDLRIVLKRRRIYRSVPAYNLRILQRQPTEYLTKTEQILYTVTQNKKSIIIVCR